MFLSSSNARASIVRGVAAVTVCTVAFVALKSVDYRGVVSRLCDMMSQDPANVADVSRGVFDDCEVPEVQPTPGHTHPQAAASRSAPLRVVAMMALKMGVPLYILQMSKSDQRRGFKGNRQWYWSKDTNVPNRSDPTSCDELLFICDTDYYIDMPHLLATEAKPVVLYTSVPREAVTQSENSTTWFEADGSLHTIVSGGGAYNHFLWDYASDSIMTKRTFLGVPWRITTYAVERKQVSDNRQIILLAPMKIFSGLSAILAFFLIEDKPLGRFNPIVQTKEGPFVRFRTHTQEGTKITTARPGQLLCCTVEASVDTAVATVARLGTTNLMLPTVASWLGKDRREASAVLTEYHRVSSPEKTPTVFPVAKAVRAYQYEPRQYDQNAKPKLEAFMSPIVHGAFAPVPNDAGERQCVKGRINDLKAEEPKPNFFRDQCLLEFVSLVAGDVVLEPVDYETVAEKQTRPAQILSLMKASLSGPFLLAVLKCFLKAEAYGDVKDPRNISTYNDSDKLDMATFALKLSEHLKQFKWYAPGMTPLKVAQRVAEICESADEFVNVSDYKRMDGTVTYFLRLVERGVLMKTFVNHRAVLDDLLKRNADNDGYLPNGTRFKQGSSHGSGCSGTSCFQTLRAAFCAYLAYRHTRRNGGEFYTPREAFEALGIHSGDDGLDADLPVKSHEWAAKKVGLILEAGTVDRGFPGVNFLARYYSEEVWSGRTDSMCDVKRQLSKFHTTVRLPHNVLAEYKLVEKAMAYVATDGNTPVIGPLCKRVLVLSDYRPKTLHGLGNWWSKFEDSAQFPNSNADGWMDVEFERQFPEFDHRVFDDWLFATKSATEILSAPLCAEPKPATPASVDTVVDEDVLLAQLPVDVDSKHKEPTPSESSYCSSRAARSTNWASDASTASRRSNSSKRVLKKKIFKKKLLPMS